MTREQEKKMTRLIRPLVEQIVKKQKLNEYGNSSDNFSFSEDEFLDAIGDAIAVGVKKDPGVKKLGKFISIGADGNDIIFNFKDNAGGDEIYKVRVSYSID